MRRILLVLILICSFRTNSQNLIQNPDFKEVIFGTYNGQQCYPNNWKSFHTPFPKFYSPKVSEIDQIFGSKSAPQNVNGIIKLQLLHPSQGIITQLIEPLEKGKTYIIEIEYQPVKAFLNGSLRVYANNRDGHSLDSADFDYNYKISLVTFFTSNEQEIKDKQNRRFCIFSMNNEIQTSYQWEKLTKTYTAKGGELFFCIGTGNRRDYINILRKEINDTLNYSHKWAFYNFRHIGIWPINENDSSRILVKNANQIDSLKAQDTSCIMTFQNLNFESGSTNLSTTSKKELNSIIDYLIQNPNMNLKIIGHTDSIGSSSYNQILSEERASSVYEYLIAFGIISDRLKKEGHGEKEPLNTTSKHQNIDKNRRVEFEFHQQ